MVVELAASTGVWLQAQSGQLYSRRQGQTFRFVLSAGYLFAGDAAQFGGRLSDAFNF
jgi:hypothetical protein